MIDRLTFLSRYLQSARSPFTRTSTSRQTTTIPITQHTSSLDAPETRRVSTLSTASSPPSGPPNALIPIRDLASSTSQTPSWRGTFTAALMEVSKTLSSSPSDKLVSRLPFFQGLAFWVWKMMDDCLVFIEGMR